MKQRQIMESLLWFVFMACCHVGTFKSAVASLEPTKSDSKSDEGAQGSEKGNGA